MLTGNSPTFDIILFCAFYVSSLVNNLHIYVQFRE